MSWRMATLRDQRVYARCNDAGEFVLEEGRVEIRYRVDDGRAYRAAARNLVALDGEPILPDSACVVAAPSIEPRPKKKAKSGKTTDGSAKIPDRGIVAYTDGACTGNPGPAGYGVILDDGTAPRERYWYIGKGTNNIAELSAIKSALDAIEDPSRPVRIYTDSQYAIGVLTKGWKAKANQELIVEIKGMLRRFSDIRLIYVRGHAGNPLNERVDTLARRAIQEQATSGWELADYSK
jgi:ribonuclease HI